MEKRTVPHVHEDTYWSVVENRRVSGGCVVQRQVLYLGEPNDNQRAGWVRTIEAFSGEDSKAKQLALFPDDREELPMMDCKTIRVQLDKLVPVKTGIELRSPREWGACRLGLYLWDLLELDKFWKQRLPSSRKGTSLPSWKRGLAEHAESVELLPAD